MYVSSNNGSGAVVTSIKGCLIVLCNLFVHLGYAQTSPVPPGAPSAEDTFQGVTFNHVEYQLRDPAAVNAIEFTPLALSNITAAWTDEGVLLSNFYSMYNPNVVQVPDLEHPFMMYFFGWAADICNPNFPGCDAVFLARGTSLTNWEVYSSTEGGRAKYESALDAAAWQPVLLNGESFYDQWHLGDPSVIKIQDTFFMAYSVTGFDADGLNPHAADAIERANDRDGFYLTIGGAYSQDGVNWHKLPRPLLSTPIELGAEDPPLQAMFHRPSLMYDGDRFKIWFDYRYSTAPQARGLALGLAELKGPPTIETFSNQQWVVVQGAQSPAIISWPNPSIIKTPVGYFAYSDPKGFAQTKWVERKVVEAYSKDGYEWLINGYIEPDSDCAANHVPEAHYSNGRIYLLTGCMPVGTPAESPRYTSIRLKSRALPGISKTVDEHHGQ